jgi:hypothetical protein
MYFYNMSIYTWERKHHPLKAYRWVSNLFNLEAFQACKQTWSGWNNNEAHDATTETASEYSTPQSVDGDLLLKQKQR